MTTTAPAVRFAIEYRCPVHGSIRELVNEGQHNTAVRYGFDCRICGTPVTITT